MDSDRSLATYTSPDSGLQGRPPFFPVNFEVDLQDSRYLTHGTGGWQDLPSSAESAEPSQDVNEAIFTEPGLLSHIKNTTNNVDERAPERLLLSLRDPIPIPTCISNHRWIEDVSATSPQDIDRSDYHTTSNSVGSGVNGNSSRGCFREGTDAKSSGSAWIPRFLRRKPVHKAVSESGINARASEIQHTRVSRDCFPQAPPNPPRLVRVDSISPLPQRIDSGLGPESMELSSPASKRYLCNVCGKSFPDSSSMKRHKRTHRRPFAYLSEGYASRYSGKKDLIWQAIRQASPHSKPGHFDTWYCDEELTGPDNLLRHVQEPHEDPFGLVERDLPIRSMLAPSPTSAPGTSYDQSKNKDSRARPSVGRSGQSNVNPASRVRIDKGKKPLRTRDDEDDDGLDSRPPTTPVKGPDSKHKPRLRCFLCDIRPGFEDVSHLRQHLKDVHHEDCSREHCGLNSEEKQHEDLRIPKWRRECLKHCPGNHPDNVCDHNPFYDPMPNPSLTRESSSVSRRQSNSHQLRRTVEELEPAYKRLQEDHNKLREEHDALQRTCESRHQKMKEQLSALQNKIDAMRSPEGALQSELQLIRSQIAILYAGQTAPLSSTSPGPSGQPTQLTSGSSNGPPFTSRFNPTAATTVDIDYSLHPMPSPSRDDSLGQQQLHPSFPRVSTSPSRSIGLYQPTICMEAQSPIDQDEDEDAMSDDEDEMEVG